MQDDRVEGTAGPDTLDGREGDDTLLGLLGDDRLIGDGGDDVFWGGAGDDRIEARAGDDTLAGQEGDDTLIAHGGNDWLIGAEGADTLFGGAGDDVLNGGPGENHLFGEAGDDKLYSQGDGLVGLHGGEGDDTLYAQKSGYGQFHLFAGAGDDALYLNLTSHENWGFQGHHVYGEAGADTFAFVETDAITLPLLGRIDDFDASRDTLIVEHQHVDPAHTPNGVEIVAHNGQQWLSIEDKALYALDGARLISDPGEADSEEVHFTPLPERIADLPEIAFAPTMNELPAEIIAAFAPPELELSADDRQGNVISGSDGRDLIRGGVLHHDNHDPVWSEIISGHGGDDLINAQEGHDTVYGGDGNDAISGGLDRDHLFGGNGDDILLGGTERDTLLGGSGDDLLQGNRNSDTLYGGKGDDTLQGGTGFDTLSGGAGSDLFRFDEGDLRANPLLDETHGAGDKVTDFRIGEDRIDFAGDARVTSLDDLKMWRVEEGDNLLMRLQIRGTGEQLTLDVDESTEWADLHDEENFVF